MSKGTICSAVGDKCLKERCYCMNYVTPFKTQTWKTCGYRR